MLQLLPWISAVTLCEFSWRDSCGEKNHWERA